MKKPDCFASRLASGFAVLFLIFSISNSCTKIEDDGGGDGVTYVEPSGYRVTIQGSFNPAEILISPGSMVTWTNDGPAIQSVTSEDGLFNGIIQHGGSYSFRFMSVGTYTYYSWMNPNKIGKVIVK